VTFFFKLFQQTFFSISHLHLTSPTEEMWNSTK